MIVNAATASVALVLSSALSSLVVLQTPPPMAPPPPVRLPAVKAKPPVKLPANVIARVGGRDLTLDDYQATVAQIGSRALVQQMVQTAVLEREAKRLGVTVTPAEVAKKLAESKAQIVQQVMMREGRPMTFDEIAAKYGITDGELSYALRSQELQKKAFLKSLETNPQVAPTLTLSGQVKLAHILIATIPLAPPAEGEKKDPATPEPTQDEKDKAAKAKIDGILADINAGKITFEDAAKQFSDDKGSGAQGGALPYFGRNQLDPAFEKAGFAIEKPGQIVGPIKSQFGYHLIKLISKGSSATAKEKADYKKKQLDQITQNPQASQQWMATLMQKTEVTFNPKVNFLAAPAPRRR